jgi:fatty-acyl-CoA synthase
MDTQQENLLTRAVLGDLVTRSANRYRKRTAIISDEQSISYQELNQRACQAAERFLSLGVGSSDRVAIMAHNDLEAVYCRFGLHKIGAIPVLINFSLRGEEIAFIVNDTKAKCLVIESSLANEIQSIQNQLQSIEHFAVLNQKKHGIIPNQWIDISTFFDNRLTMEPELIIKSDDVATLMYTSGTEGFPKGVKTTHNNYMMGLLHQVIDFDYNADNVCLLDIPLFHIAGTSVLLTTLAVGGKVVLADSPNPVNTLTLTQRHGITAWGYPPTVYHALLAVPDFENYDLSSLKRCAVFGAKMPRVLLEKWQQRLNGLRWYNKWGQTESTPLGTTLWPEDFEQNLDSIGRPDFGTTISVVDDNGNHLPTGEEGELVIRGPSIMQGYWNLPEKTTQVLSDGWLHSGDLGYIDENGLVYFTDRKKDMIKSGGENISSQEVEGVLLSHPQVMLAAVIGLADEYWVEAVTAVVTLKPSENLLPNELISFCKSQMAGYKVPKAVHIVEQLPLSATGKVLKRELRERFENRQSNVHSEAD